MFIEVRKHLTAEDFMQLSQMVPELMNELERKYNNGELDNQDREIGLIV